MKRSMTLRVGAVSIALALVALLSAGCIRVAEEVKAVPTVKPAQNQTTEQPSKSTDTGLVAQDEKPSGNWGTVKGSILYSAKDKIPENPKVNVTADKNVCLAKGPLLQNEWVVDPKSKGVKWVLVWLTDASNTKGSKTNWPANQIHPTLKKAPEKMVLDQPVCAFAPRLIGMREESKLVYKNSSTIPHNVKIEGGDLGPNLNQIIPPGKELEVKDKVTARYLPFSYSCTIHAWMKGWIASFKHPYFAVTNEKGEFEIKNAPAGKFRMMVWHEGYGFVQKDKNNRGIVIEIPVGKTLEVKAIEIKKED